MVQTLGLKILQSAIQELGLMGFRRKGSGCLRSRGLGFRV